METSKTTRPFPNCGKPTADDKRSPTDLGTTFHGSRVRATVWENRNAQGRLPKETKTTSKDCLGAFSRVSRLWWEDGKDHQEDREGEDTQDTEGTALNRAHFVKTRGYHFHTLFSPSFPPSFRPCAWRTQERNSKGRWRQPRPDFRRQKGHTLTSESTALESKCGILCLAPNAEFLFFGGAKCPFRTERGQNKETEQGQNKDRTRTLNTTHHNTETEHNTP